MDIAKRVALMSYAVRKKVGCVIVKEGNIISMGWNGMPSGMPNRCEVDIDGTLVTRSEVSHAEENAIGKLAMSNNSSLGAILYVTLEPCIHCAKLINTAGIRYVIYDEDYRDHTGIEYLKSLGIGVQKLN